MQKERQEKSSSQSQSILDSSSARFGHSSPLRLFSISIASIFFAEVVAMIAVRFIEPLPYYQTTLIDAGIMIVLIFPILYLFSFSPLLQYIEKLREAERTLQEKEELKERFFDSIDTLIAYMDRGFNFIRVNDAYAKEGGHLPEYFIGKNHFDLYPHAENLEIFRQVVRTGEAYTVYEKPFEFPSQPERGVTYWNWSLQPVSGPEGKVEGVVLSQVNVTARKQAENRVHEMALFPTLNPDAVLQVDANGRIRKSNPVAEQMGLGSGMELLKIIPAFKNVDLAGFIETGSTKDVYEAPLDERILQWTMRAAPELGLAFLYSKDVTERKRSEEAVHLLSSIVEQTADTVVVTNCDGLIEYVNPAFEQLTGYPKTEVLGKTPRVLKSGVHNEQFYMKMWDTILNGQVFHSEMTNRKKNDDVFHETKTITPLRNQRGEITHFVATGKNITERKQAEEQLRKAFDDLEIRVQDRTEELRIANSELEDEIHVRWQAEEALRLAHEQLELRVQERTEELATANRELSNEIAERKEIERQLRIQTAAMDAAANGILITDPKGVILWTNPAVTEISGYTYQELKGQSTRLFNSGRQDPDFYQQMWATILAGKVWQGETINRRKDGGSYVEEQTITPVRDENGQISHFIAIKQDVTERKLIYSQLEDSNRELTTLTTSERQQRLLAEGLVESSVVLNMSLELHAVLDRIIEQTRRTIPYLMADIVLIDEDIANVVRQWGFETHTSTRTVFEHDNLKLQDFPTWEEICATKSVVMISDTRLEDQWNTYFRMDWVRSYLGAPLIYDDQVIGIINLTSDQAGAFHEEMARTLRAFAAPAAVAIQNARLYENEQQNRRIAEILSAATVALAQTLDTQMVMETILDYVQFVMPCDAAFVLLSEGDERYRARAIRLAEQNSQLRDLFQDRIFDVLSEPAISFHFQRNASTSIPDSREIAGWNPPIELASMNCWLGIPLESMGKFMGVVVVAHGTAHSFTRQQIQLAEAVVKQAVVALQNAWLFEQVRSGRERLQQLSRHLVEVQENERKYIARELHDETSQSLTSLKLGLQVIEQKAAGHEQLMEQIIKLKVLANETLESLHHLAVNLRPASLDHLGLVDALTGLIQSTRQRSGLTAHFKTMGSMPIIPLTDEMETSIYRIAQESITNVIRHAHANYVDVILEWQDDKIVVIIEDDGIGIDRQKASEKGHLGMIGMQERAEMLGGKLLVDSTPEIGTTLVVEIPYAY